MQSQLVLPTRNQFPVDEVIGRLCGLLKQRDWQVPGITVKFQDIPLRNYVEIQRHYVNEIVSDTYDFYIRLYSGGVRQIIISGKSISVYDDESGPLFRYYVGNNWKRDRNIFIHGPLLHSRLYGHPKIYLQYDGSMRSDKIVGKRDAYFCDRYARPFYLVHYNDLGREYDPVGDEPKYFVLGDVFKEYVTYLENVIQQIQ